MYVRNLPKSITKRPNLELKTQAAQILGRLPLDKLDIAVPEACTIKLFTAVIYGFS
jgi:hypothetical protein